MYSLKAKKLLIFLFFIYLSQASMAQTGPGGVGSISNTVLWLRADDIQGLSNGDDIVTWLDKSGNSNNMTPPAAQYSPIYISNGINGLPIVRFNHLNNERLQKLGVSKLNSGDWFSEELSIVYVNKTTDSNDVLFSYSDDNISTSYYTLSNSQNLRFEKYETDFSIGQAINNDQFQIAGIGLNVDDAVAAPSNVSRISRMEFWLNGTLIDDRTNQVVLSTNEIVFAQLIEEGGDLVLGGLETGFSSATSHNGDFAEVIVFDEELNSARQIIVHNYLAAKYGITINNDYFAYESTHPHDLIGIGRETSSDRHLESVSESGLAIKSSSGLNANGEYFFVGSDNGDYTTWTTTETANGNANIQRLAREWRVTETGELGEMEFTIDASQLPSLPSDYTVYTIMVDSDGDFSSGAKVYGPTSNSGTDYSYVLDVADGDYIAVGVVKPTFTHNSTSVSGAENKNASIGYSINYVSATDITLQFATSDLTAIAGADYTETTSQIIIPGGTTTGVYTIEVTQDVLAENNEKFQVVVSKVNVSDDIHIENPTVVYTIEDSPFVGYKGPGGVGDESTNKLWLNSEDITLNSNGTSIDSWDDVSGNGNSLGMGNGSVSTLPTYSANVVNGYGGVFFDGVNDRMVRNPFIDFPNTAITAIYVNQTTGTEDGTISYAIPTNSNEVWLLRSSALKLYLAGVSIQTDLQANSGNFEMTGFRWRSSDDNLRIDQNGTLGLNTTLNTGNSSIEANGSLAIGADQDIIDGDYGQYHNGTFAELVIYNVYLNSAQNIIVNNYLAAKYNLTIVDDYYAYESTHSNDLAGIGREDADNIHKAAMSANILRLEEPSNLINDESYMMFGHDGGDISTWSESIGINTLKIARDWRVNKTNDMGNVDIIVDTEDLPALPNGYSEYVLLIDADGDFSSDAVPYMLVNDQGSEFKYEDISFNDGDYISIAVIDPTLSITSSNPASGVESADFTFDVALNFISQEEITVQVNVSNVSTSSSDYNQSNSNLTIPSGDMTGNYTLDIVNDGTVELDEVLSVSFSNPSRSLTLPISEITYTIIDNDLVTVTFSDFAYVGYEDPQDNPDIPGAANPSIVIQSSAAIDFDAVVSYSVLTGSGRAVEGDDFVLVGNGTLTINAGETEATLPVNVIDDGFFEGGDELAELFVLKITPVAYTKTTDADEVFYIINDNLSVDNYPQIGFTNTSGTGSEISNPIIPISIDRISGREATVNYTATGGTATGGGVDYTLVSGTITIPAGDTEASITIDIEHDDLIEDTETIIVTLSSPDGAVLGTNTTFTHSITDSPKLGASGPGGVGDVGNNILWLRADDIQNLSNGSDVTGWQDTSGNGNSMSQSVASQRPQFIENVVNGFPIVRFNDLTNDQLEKSMLSKLDPSSWNADELSIVYVNKTTDSDDVLFSYTHDSHSAAYYQLSNSGDLRFERLDSDFSIGQAINNDEFQIAGIGTNIEDLVAQLPSSTTVSKMEFWLNGALIDDRDNQVVLSNNEFSFPKRIEEGGDLILGGLETGFTQTTSHSGDFAEVIIFDEELNAARQIIIHNYLAAKYRIPISNDYYDHELTHYYQVIGVGRETSGDQHLESISESGIAIKSGPGLNANGEYFLVGSNNEDYTSWTTAETANGDVNTQRLAREWRVSETGELDTIEFKIDASQMPSLPNGYSMYTLMVDADGDFSDGAKVYEPNGAEATVYSYLLDVDDGDYLAVGVIDPTISFSTVNSSGAENRDATIEISVNYIPINDITINISTESVSAIAGEDYEAVDATVVIPAGTTRTQYVISITQDEDEEPDESFKIIFSNVEGEDIVGSEEILYTIEDSPLVGYKGPGGVGDENTNKLWLNSQDIALNSNGTSIDSWDDVSGNGNSLGMGNGLVSTLPTYSANVLNGYGGVVFDGVDDRMVRNPFLDFPSTAITAIYVNQTTDTGDGTISYAITSNANEVLLIGSRALELHVAGASTQTAIDVRSVNFELTGFRWRSSDDNMRIDQNGAIGINTTLNTGNSSIEAGGSLAIGADQDAVDGGYGQYHNGTFTEMVMYNIYLNGAQNIIVNNYLAAKYNLTIIDDYYAYESTHSHDLAGIGREDADNIHKAAMSADILRLEEPSNLINDVSYMMFGHNGGDISAWSQSVGVNTMKVARDWRLDKTNEMGAIDVVVDLKDFPALPNGFSDYVLLVDSDGDFSTDPIPYLLVYDQGTEYKSAGLTLNDGDHISIAVIIPTLAITSDNPASGSENSDFTFDLATNFIVSEDVTVDVSVTNSTTTTDDYVTPTEPATILTGTNAISFTIEIVNDEIDEPDESFFVNFSNPSITIELPASDFLSYTINDNDVAKLSFEVAAFLVTEGDPLNEPDILIETSNISTVDIQVQYYIATTISASGVSIAATAIEGLDFDIFHPRELTIPAGSSSVTIPKEDIDIVDDGLYEIEELFFLKLREPVNAQLNDEEEFLSYVIYDSGNPGKPEIAFSTASEEVSESASISSVSVSLATVSGVEAAVDYQVSGGTATGGGVDYVLASGTLTIPEGSLESFIDISLVHDGLVEGTETIEITLSNPDEAELGSNSVFTLNILDAPEVGTTGPGGVGNASSNMLWLVPDEIVTHSNGTSVADWLDISGNDHGVSQADQSNSPTYLSNRANGFSGVFFDGSNDRLVRNPFTNFPSSAITAIYANSTSESGDGILSYATGTSASSNEFLIFNSANLKFHRAGATIDSNIDISSGNYTISGFRWQSSDGSLKMEKNGSIGLDTQLSAAAITTGGSLAIGGEQDAVDGGYSPSQFHQGTFTEVILYNVFLNETQNIIVNNYLSAKFDIALTANDVYDGDESANGNYDYQVAGIGQVSVGDNHLEAQGSGIVSVRNPRSIDANEFFVWGHDNGSLRATSLNVPTSISRRFERIWRVSQSDVSGNTVDVGGVDLSFDLIDLGTVRAEDLVLLVDTDTDFSSGATEVGSATLINASRYRFTNVSIPDNAFFTLATANHDETPLPVELMFFEGREVEDSNVQLNWATASEVNNSHFNIERSIDGIEFEILNAIPGLDLSSNPVHYTYLDQQPFEGLNYYRLQQVDKSGAIDYSEVVSVPIKSGNKQVPIILFPNPIEIGGTARISYQSDTGKRLSVQIVNSQGIALIKNSHDVVNGNNIIELKTDQLASGVYMIRILDADGVASVLKLLVK